MTTSVKTLCLTLGACVAALAIATGCGPRTTAAPTPETTTVTVTPPTETVTPPTKTVTAPPSTPPTKTASKPPAKVTPTKPPVTKKPALKLGPNQAFLYPEPETADGDPGGPKWDEVGRTSGDRPKCNPRRDPIDFKVPGTKSVRGSELTVTETKDYTVVRTNLKATALLMNSEAAAKLPEKFWKRTGMPPTYTFFLPKATWGKTLGSDIYSIWACSVTD